MNGNTEAIRCPNGVRAIETGNDEDPGRRTRHPAKGPRIKEDGEKVDRRRAYPGPARISSKEAGP